MATLHQCPTCGQTCRTFTPKKTLDTSKRDRGLRCGGCNTKGINHTPTCPVYLATRERLLATRPEDLRLNPALLARMAPIPYDNKRRVGGVLYARLEDAEAQRARIPEAEAALGAAREAQAAWRERWKAEAALAVGRDTFAELEAAA